MDVLDSIDLTDRSTGVKFVSRAVSGHNELCKSHNHYADTEKAVNMLYDAFENKSKKLEDEKESLENRITALQDTYDINIKFTCGNGKICAVSVSLYNVHECKVWTKEYSSFETVLEVLEQTLKEKNNA